MSIRNLIITGSYKIGDADEDIFEIWERTKELMKRLGRDEEAEEFDAEINDLDVEDAEDYYEEYILPFMNEISPVEELVFGINDDDEIGYWHESNIPEIREGDFDEDEDEYEDEDEDDKDNESDEEGDTEETINGRIEPKEDDIVIYPKDNIISVCMKCKHVLNSAKNATDQTWDQLTEEEKKRVSHGLCNECLDKYYKV